MPRSVISSEYVSLLSRVAELARRFGLRPSQANAILFFDSDRGMETLEFVSGFAPGHERGALEKRENYSKMLFALGCDPQGIVRTGHLSELEDIVENAISVAPRARTR